MKCKDNQRLKQTEWEFTEWERAREEFINLYEAHERRTMLAERKPELIEALRAARTRYDKAIHDNKPRTILEEKEGIALLEKKLELNLSNKFMDEESAKFIARKRLEAKYEKFSLAVEEAHTFINSK